MEYEFLVNKILEFIEVIYECHSDTTFLNDRSVYKEDLVVAIGWIIELRSGVNYEYIREKILSKNTNKYFSDYWRQGDWGDRLLSSFERLKDSI